MYGKRISDRINELNLSQQEVAKYVGVSSPEIYRIINDKKKTINKQTFLKLMECLDLNPYEFGGFVKLDLTSGEDFILELDFLKLLKEFIGKNNGITAKDISEVAGFSESLLSRLLSGERNLISIDSFVHICNYIGVDYKKFLVDKNIVPSFYNKEQEEPVNTSVSSSDIEFEDLVRDSIIKNYISNLKLGDKDYLIQYIDFLYHATDKDKEVSSQIIKQLRMNIGK